MTVRQMSGPYRTVADLTKATAQAYPDREAFVCGDERLTFGRLDQAAEGVAALFADEGVRRGDVVCLVLASSVDFAVCYHAAIKLGALTSAINPRLGVSEVTSIIERSRPTLTVSTSEWSLPVENDKVLGTSQCRLAWDSGPLSNPVRLDPADPVAVVWTSGTTGRPKGAVFDHRNLEAVSRGAGELSAPGDRRLSPLPFAHVGFMTRPWEEMRNVVTTVVTATPWRAADALALIEREGVTVAQGVPAQWSLMLAHPAFGSTDLSSLRVAGTGAASVPPEMVTEMRERLGCPVIVGYASTEAAIICRSRIGDSDEDVARTVGTAADGVEIQVVDGQGRPLPPGGVGRVRCRSAAAMRHYWEDPAATAEVLDASGWLDTGDLGRLDERGFLTLCGRGGDMYIRGGYNVYPAEVEGVLSEHPSVSACAVVGAPAEVLGQVGVAFVVVRGGCDGQGGLEQDLQEWVRARLADYKVPDRVVRLETLPLTAMSKVDKVALAALAAGSTAGR